MQENNELLKTYIQNAIISSENSLKSYITQQINNIPQAETFTKEQIQGFIQEAINQYDIESHVNFKTKDNKMFVTKDNKIFYSK
jgi:hypothetical protein